MRFIASIAATSLLVLSVIAPATSADLDEQRRQFELGVNVPLCDEPSVLKKIQKRFSRVHEKYRDSTLAIDNVFDIRETDAEAGPVPEFDKRFCVAEASLNDGNNPTLYYLILDNYGLASIGWGVDYCVQGYDYERAHGEKCRSVRAPF